MPSHSAPAPRPFEIEAREISKSFGGAQALDSVSVAVRPGTVHALVGENGAGKSTLGKILAGIHRPESGRILVGGEPVEFTSPRDALAAGITIITQELALERSRSVMDNVFLGRESTRVGMLDASSLRRRYDDLVESAGFHVPPAARVGGLRIADQQKVEILRALARQARVIVMDEPTAALTAAEAERLTEVVRSLRDRGTTVIYVSHFLDEVLRVADEVTVLRSGQVVQSTLAADVDKASLVTAMLGRPFDLAFPPKRMPNESAKTVLSVRGLSRAGALEGIDLDVREGEILGLVGLVGSGRTELVRCIFGADRFDTGHIELQGRSFAPRSPRDAVAQGMAMIPESRKDQGLVMRRSVLENLSLAHLAAFSGPLGFVRGREERLRAAAVVDATDIRTPGLGIAVGALSGGNQQKILFARWLDRRPCLLIADEPTRGVDVGAKVGIYGLLVRMAAEGAAVVVISSEVEEVLGLAHRIVVLNSGQVVGRFDGPDFEREAVMNSAFTTPRSAVA